MSGGDESVLMRAFLDQWFTDEYKQWLAEYLATKETTPMNTNCRPQEPPAGYTNTANPGFFAPAIPVPSDSVLLNKFDPFESVLINIVDTNRKKRKDYAADGDPFSNFETSSDLLGLQGFGPIEASLFNVTQKLARLKALRTNGRMRDTANESVADTYLDLAVYAVITYAIYMQQTNRISEAESVRSTESGDMVDNFFPAESADTVDDFFPRGCDGSHH